MSLTYIYDIQRLMSTSKVVLAYEGEFSQEITKSVLAMTERNMDSLGEENTVKRKVFNVMMECMQNIVKHGEESPKTISDGAAFIIGRTDDAYEICTGNYMKASEVDIMRKRLDDLNSLDEEGLKTLYKEVIKGGTLSERGGAGLGFIDMARKSGNKLQYEFVMINNEIAFFALKTVISRVSK